MQVSVISVLSVLTWVLVLTVADEDFPKITKSIIKGVEEPNHLPSFVRFGDSDTLVLAFGSRLHISFNDGDQWETVNGIEGTDMEIFLDKFHHKRAFISDRSLKLPKFPEVHITEDQGKSWRKFSLPEDVKLNGTKCSPISHPYNEELILLECSLINSDFLGRRHSYGAKTVYGSDNAGTTFKRIMKIMDSDLIDLRSKCTFAASSASRMKDNGVYCIESSESNRLHSLNQTHTDLWEKSHQERSQNVGTLFYTSDLGKTKKTFDELSGFSVEQIFILPSGVALLTRDANDAFDRSLRLWFRKDEIFKVVCLPEGMVILYVHNLSEDDQGRLELTASIKDIENYQKFTSLISDSSGLNFSLKEPKYQSDHGSDHVNTLACGQLEHVGNLKGSQWRAFQTFNNTEEERKETEDTLFERFDFYRYFQDSENTSWAGNIINWLTWIDEFAKLLKNFFFKEPGPYLILQYMTKGCFDNGKTWNNLRAVDHSGQHKHLFKCDVEDVEYCSIQLSSQLTTDSTAGIIMGRATVGKYGYFYLSTSKVTPKDEMTFISRDGGASWELAFEFTAKIRLLDFGNIILALPDSNNRYTKILFSLDQGRSWGEYSLDRTIYADKVVLNKRGLKVYIGFNALGGGIFSNIKRKSGEYVHYSVDFSNIFNGTACTEDDWERWYLSNGNCFDDKKYSRNRRKPNAKCLMQKTFEKLELQEEACEA